MRISARAFSGALIVPAILAGVASAKAGPSVAAGDAVYIADEAAATVTRYNAATASAAWVAEVGSSRAVDLAIDAAGNIVAAGTDSLGSGRNVEFDVLRAADGEDSGAEAPSLSESAITQDLAGFQIVNGEVAGFFLRPPFREESWLELPLEDNHSFRSSHVAAVGYLGTGYDFVVELDGNARPARRLYVMTTNTEEEPVLAAGEDRAVEQYEPDNEIYNSLCRMSLNGEGAELVLAAVSSRSRSTPSNGSSTTYCAWDSGDMDTLIVQVIDRQTLLPKWTATTDGSYRLADTAVASANGKVYAVAALTDGSVQLTELDAGTGAVLETKTTDVLQGSSADEVRNVYVLSSGSIAITGLFEGYSPVLFYADGQFTVGTEDCV